MHAMISLRDAQTIEHWVGKLDAVDEESLKDKYQKPFNRWRNSANARMRDAL
jgi:hypothetical protein